MRIPNYQATAGLEGLLDQDGQIFIALDDAMMVIAITTFDIWNPFTLLGPTSSTQNSNSLLQGELAGEAHGELESAEDSEQVKKHVVMPKEVA